jgi:hypothetical protein
MRWLLPLVVAVALAICAVDPTSPSSRRRARTALDRPAWLHPQVPVGAAGHDHTVPAATATEDRQAATRQTATFDPATGMLTWFDDDEGYN